ncbi:hypothetical protein ABKN59_006345 [Abortiporus biennis]
MADTLVLTPTIPLHRHRSPEIIDLMGDDDDIVFTGYRRSQPRRRLSRHDNVAAGPSNHPEVIEVLDSDDEQSITRRSMGHSRRLISPPPMAVAPQTPPPVPPLPRTHRHHHHHHRHPHLAQPPAIVPNAQPFDFETQLHGNRRAPAPVILPPRAAPRSHHQPVMGLGGAIVSLNRQTAAQEEARRRDLMRNRLFGINFGALSEFYRNLIGSPEHQHTALDELFEDDHYGPGLGWDPAVDRPYWRYKNSRSSDVTWKPQYTHPDKLRPGYTSSFSTSQAESSADATSGASTPQTVIVIDDDEEMAGPSSSHTLKEIQVETNTTMVCAQCLDPLRMVEDGGEDERRNRRIYALRCGHMLDGKCVQSLMRPKQAVMEEVISLGIEGDEVNTSEQIVGKGKGKAVEKPMTGRRGKGRAPGVAASETVSSLAQATAEVDSIRSRLRSRRSQAQAGDAHTPAYPNAASNRPILPLPRRAKGKGKQHKPHVSEEYAWKCPVSGCGREHKSIVLSDADRDGPDGGWVMDVDEGAIVLFV